jgi:hypothetical protein
MLSQWTELTALFFVEDKPPYLMKAYYELLINIVISQENISSQSLKKKSYP